MRVRLAGPLMAVCCLLGLAVSAYAHHGFGVEFDGSKCMDLKGTLSGLVWENPHAYLQIVGQLPERDITPDKLNF